MRLLFAEEGRVTLQYTMTQVERFQHTWCYQLSCVDASVVGGDFPQAAGIFQSATETDAECQETKSKIHQKSKILPKTNMEPENHLFEKENHLPNLHFWVPC